MEKHEDNLDKLLKAELEKEAGEIMEEMDSDESLQDISFPEDLDEKMWSKIQAYEEQQKAYEKLSDADKEAIRLGREVQALRGGENTKDHLKKDVESDSYIDNVVPIEHVKHEADNKASDDGTNGETGKEKVKKRKRHWKAYGIVAIVAVLAMMWSMVSIGGTPFFGKLWTQTIGDRKMTQVDTEREDGDKNKVDDYDEESVYEEIKEKFGMDVVRFRRKSDGMALVQSDIDEVLKKVCLIYENNNTFIQYQMEIQSENKSYAYDIEDKKVKRTQITVDGNKIDIIQYELDDGNEENVAQFAYEDVFYTINTTMEEADFKELLKNLYFF